MRPRTSSSTTWMRLVRGVIAALVLVLAPAPAVAGEAVIVDAVQLVADARAEGKPSADDALAGADATTSRPPAPTAAAPHAHEARARIDVATHSRHAPLFLLHCALLR